MAGVLVGIVGFNPVSVLVAARALSPRRVLLLCTEQSEPQAAALEALLAPPVTIVCWDAVPGLSEVRESIAEDLGDRGEGPVFFDITGGTKPLAIGAWQGLTAACGDRLRGLYLDQSGVLRDADRGAPLGAEVTIHPDDFLRLRGAQVRKVAWEGALEDMPEVMLRRMPLARALYEHLGRTPLCTDIERGAVHCRGAALPRPLPPGFSVRGGWLVAEGDRNWLGKHRWLEELCLGAAREALNGVPGVRAALSLEIRGAEGAQDEMDVVLTRGSRVTVIEAKARGRREGAGVEALKRLHKARRFFSGPNTRVLFVHPIWGRDAGRYKAIETLGGRNFTILGGRYEALLDSIRAGLG